MALSGVLFIVGKTEIVEFFSLGVAILPSSLCENELLSEDVFVFKIYDMPD